MPPQNGQLDPLHYINVGAEGTFKPSGNFKSTPEDVDRIIDEIKTKGITTLVLYLHGGLVSEGSGMNSAIRMKEQFQDTAAKRHMVSFVWETGPFEVIKQIDKETKNKLLKIVLKKVIKLAAKKLDVSVEGRSAGGYMSDEEIDAQLASGHPFADDERDLGSRGGFDIENVDDDELVRTLEIESGFVMTLDDQEAIENMTPEEMGKVGAKIQQEAGGEDARGAGLIFILKTIASVAFRVIKRYVNKSDHDFYPTVMEEIFREFYVADVGTFGWAQIKQKAEKMFAKNTGRNGIELHSGEYFLEKLNGLIGSGAIPNNIKIEVIGHSAGSIAVCFLLDAIKARHSNIKINNIFFLAPACRVDLFNKHLVPALGFTFNAFRIFTMRKEKEKEDHCIGPAYTRSLLYLVSGCFEDEVDANLVGLHEHFSAEGRYAVEPLISLKKFLLDFQHRAILSDIVDADLKLCSKALKHGDFDNDPHTLDAIKATI